MPETIKKRILVGHFTPPKDDQNSGDRRLLEILRLLLKMGHEVSYLTTRAVDEARYADNLLDMGIPVFVPDNGQDHPAGNAELICGWRAGDPMELSGFLRDARFDFVLTYYFYVALELVPIIRRFSPSDTPIWCDSVDVHYLREMREAAFKDDPKFLADAQEKKGLELEAYQLVDGVITVTEEDRRHLQEALPGCPVQVVPNVHDLVPSVPPWGDRRDLLFVGSFNHRPNIDAVFWFVEEILPLIHQRNPEMLFTVVGGPVPDAIANLASGHVRILGYVPDLDPLLKSHRVSVAPLRFGAGMKGKIGQALEEGIPVVTTRVGAEGMLGPDDEAVLSVAGDPTEFANQVLRVHEDRDLWDRYSRNGQAFIERNYSSRVVHTILERFISSAVTWR